MKKQVLILLFSSGSLLLACGQKTKPTDAAKAAFEKLYPGDKPSWEKEDGNFEASFKQGDIDFSVVIDEKGNILETEIGIPINQLPATVASYIKAHYPGASIKEASKIVKANGDLIYEALVKGKDVLFDAAGNFIKEVSGD